MLRLRAADDEVSLLGSDQHEMIGIAFKTIATPARGPIPIELALTPRAAAGLSVMLRDLELDDKIPEDAVRTVEKTRQ